MPKLVPAVKPHIQSREDFVMMLHNIANAKINTFSSSLKSACYTWTREEVIKNLIWIFPNSSNTTNTLHQHVNKLEDESNDSSVNLGKVNACSRYGVAHQDNTTIAVSSVFVNECLKSREKPPSSSVAPFSDADDRKKNSEEDNRQSVGQSTRSLLSISQIDAPKPQRQQQQSKKNSKLTTVKIERPKKRPRSSQQMVVENKKSDSSVEYVSPSGDKSVEGRHSDNVEIISQTPPSIPSLRHKLEDKSTEKSASAPRQRLITSFLIRKDS
ncbi:unnamed protein product [Phytomonas sp. EM1]|nr:unnamed protein product [Phytomonas sp. EM1]|eukprot:CCW59596.1 unnamed protein product [Phytomonas sp. isolate EM1]